ncbi:hypothetical protein [Niallia sp. 03133]|uniref:hypothetical protein n=1 Tax=Niallia sp. 03133 TaxID=3458060 RepID=UPI004043E369
MISLFHNGMKQEHVMKIGVIYGGIFDYFVIYLRFGFVYLRFFRFIDFSTYLDKVNLSISGGLTAR